MEGDILPHAAGRRLQAILGVQKLWPNTNMHEPDKTRTVWLETEALVPFEHLRPGT